MGSLRNEERGGAQESRGAETERRNSEEGKETGIVREGLKAAWTGTGDRKDTHCAETVNQRGMCIKGTPGCRKRLRGWRSYAYQQE